MPLEFVFFFFFEGSAVYKISPLIPATTKKAPSRLPDPLQPDAIPPSVWLRMLSCSLLKTMNPMFFSSEHIWGKTKPFPPPLTDVSIFFAESVIKAFFLFFLVCITVTPCNLTLQFELMNINGWLPILFVEKHTHTHAPAHAHTYTQCCSGWKRWTMGWRISQISASTLHFSPGIHH